jgi:hypothetical protein
LRSNALITRGASVREEGRPVVFTLPPIRVAGTRGRAPAELGPALRFLAFEFGGPCSDIDAALRFG